MKKERKQVQRNDASKKLMFQALNIRGNEDKLHFATWKWYFLYSFGWLSLMISIPTFFSETAYSFVPSYLAFTVPSGGTRLTWTRCEPAAWERNFVKWKDVCAVKVKKTFEYATSTICNIIGQYIIGIQAVKEDGFRIPQ